MRFALCGKLHDICMRFELKIYSNIPALFRSNSFDDLIHYRLYLRSMLCQLA